MNAIKSVMIAAIISIISISAYADMPTMPNQQGNMPMMGNQQGSMPMMGNRREMMQSMMSMKQQHMHKMENHLANIEALLRELVAIQKANQSK